MRRAALTVHRRLAVVLGLWIAFQSLTGLVLVFRDPIEHWTNPGLTHHGDGDMGAAAALEAVRRKFPDEVVGALATPAVSDEVYVVEVGEREVYVDPARARINGSRNHEAGFTALVYRLHRRFLFDSFFGLPGARLVGTVGLAWLVLSVTGLTSAAAGRFGRWWKRKQLTGRWWRPLPAGARRTPHILHRTIGFVVVAPMVLVVVTGVRLAVPAGSDRIWAAVTGSGHGRYDTPPKGVSATSDDRGGDPMDATQVLSALDRKYPDGQVARLLMPFPGDRMAPVIAGVSVGLDPGKGQHEYGGNTVVFLDQYTADTLWEGRPDALPVARQVALLWSRPLHTGSFAGRPGTLLWGWLAAAVVALGLSGFVTRRVRTLEARLEKLRWQRQLRRRRVLARRQRSRIARAARSRRRTGRRLRRRRKVQARTQALARDRAVARDRALARSEAPAATTASPPGGSNGHTGIGETIIDLTDGAIPVVYESEITLESGETLESGIVVPLPRG
ncbi:MAG TPA: PepSY-associated TM helix domain-containing protein [Acidimicrobiia bacterium]|nr:PepSY-associated TM helix domain-containing protein [Acidimicrobiia bacterium]